MKKTGEKKIMAEADILSLMIIVLVIKGIFKYLKKIVLKRGGKNG